MATKVFNWETEFDRNGHSMIHHLTGKINVMTDFKELEITVFKDGEAINKIDCKGMTLSEYASFLKDVVENAEILKSFDHE